MMMKRFGIRNSTAEFLIFQIYGKEDSVPVSYQAKANIDGEISSEEVGKRLDEYYRQKWVREKAEEDGTIEADRVAYRIILLLA